MTVRNVALLLVVGILSFPTIAAAQCDGDAAQRAISKYETNGVLSSAVKHRDVVMAYVDAPKWRALAAEMKIELAKALGCKIANAELSDAAFLSTTDNGLLAVQKNGTLNIR
jgi:hypothetical protein